MSKVLLLISKKRIEEFYDLSNIPTDWELIFCEEAMSDDDTLKLGSKADFIFVDAIRQVSQKLIFGMDNLKLIHSEGVGFDKIDINAAKERGIFVCNNAGANAVAVAEHTIMLMLGLQRRILEGDQLVRNGYQKEAKNSFIMNGIPELGSSHIGFIGFGKIAKETAKRLNSFGSKLSYYDVQRDFEAEASLVDLRYLPLDDLLKNCDIVSLHLPVLSETINLINKERLSLMKSSALLINTARGELVVQEDLVDALIAGTISGAGLDTLTPEPVTLDNPLLNVPEEIKFKLILTPHIAGTTKQAFEKMHENAWKNMLAVARGERPTNIVNKL